MKDTKEIILFLKKDIEYSPIDIANDLKLRFSEIGNPIVLPPSKDKNIPLIVFSENLDFQIQCGYHTVTIVVNYKYFDKLHQIIFDVNDAFNGVNCDFVRMGIINNVFLSPKKIDAFKIKYLNEQNVGDLNDFNIGWYKILFSDFGEINCWERFITSKHEFNDLLCQYDFNSPANKEIELSMKYIKEFINVSNEYLNKRIDF